MPVSFKRDVVVVVRPAWIDERGDMIQDWDHATEHAEPGCRLQPITGAELLRTGTANRDAIVSRWHLSAPAGADIDARDRIRHAGQLYDIDGSVERWPSPTGALASTQAVLKRVEG